VPIPYIPLHGKILFSHSNRDGRPQVSLFADAKSVFYHWWRKPKPLEPPIIMDMFANSKILGPN